jgi:hypothetical protein
MVVVGLLVGTFEPARVMVAIAQASSASATANTAPPIQSAGSAAGMNGKGMSQSSASPTSTATSHAIGGRITTWAVSAVSVMRDSWTCHRGDKQVRCEERPINSTPRRERHSHQTSH